MRIDVFAVIALSVSLLGGCGGKSADSPATQAAPKTLAKDAATPQPKAAGHDIPVPPKDARYTILCRTISGPDHVFQARKLRDDLVKTTGMKDWYIITGEGETSLYYGYYASVDDASRAGRQAQRDRQKIAAITDVALNRPFAHAMAVEIVSADPTAPPEWNLANADGFWSLQVAAFKDHPDRKQAAVDAVRDARALGIDAYFYHGPTVSSVCIGAWPREAVREQDANLENEYISADRPLLVLPHALPSGVSGDIRGPDGEKVQAVVPRIEYTDPNLVATLRKYPYHLINGMEVRLRNPKTGELSEHPEPSFLVQIPVGDRSILSGGTNNGAAPAEPAPTHIPTYPARPAPGGGKLKSIGG